MGKSPMEVHRALASRRARQGITAPTLSRFRKALRGLTYKRSRKETRGRKQKVTRQHVLKMDNMRKRLIKKAEGQREIRWEDVRKASRVHAVHRSTLKRAFLRDGAASSGPQPSLEARAQPSAGCGACCVL